MNTRLRLLAIPSILLLLLQVSACASSGLKDKSVPEPGVEQTSSQSAENDLLADFDEYDEEEGPVIADPLEPWNRFWFEFNDIVYTAVMPITDAYEYVVPEPVRDGVSNFFHNLAAPVRITNNLLQGKFLAAGVEFSRFIGNTFFGFLGFSDHFNDKKAIVDVEDDEDLGQTLGVWGFDEGCYLVLPLLGPSTVRDTVGMIGDTFLSPVTYVQPRYLSNAISGYEQFHNLSLRLGQYEELKASAVEPYSAFRNAYVESRREQLTK